MRQLKSTIIGGVAQLVRATACHAVGHRFESGRPRIKIRFLAAFLLGRTRTGKGSGKREFFRGGSIETARFQRVPEGRVRLSGRPRIKIRFLAAFLLGRTRTGKSDNK